MTVGDPTCPYCGKLSTGYPCDCDGKPNLDVFRSNPMAEPKELPEGFGDIGNGMSPKVQKFGMLFEGCEKTCPSLKAEREAKEQAEKALEKKEFFYNLMLDDYKFVKIDRAAVYEANKLLTAKVEELTQKLYDYEDTKKTDDAQVERLQTRVVSLEAERDTAIKAILNDMVWDDETGIDLSYLRAKLKAKYLKPVQMDTFKEWPYESSFEKLPEIPTMNNRLLTEKEVWDIRVEYDTYSHPCYSEVNKAQDIKTRHTRRSEGDNTHAIMVFAKRLYGCQNR